MSASLLALIAAASLAVGYALTKQFVGEYPPRQLIGPLYGLNAIVLVPAAPFAHWRWSWHIALLLALSVCAMVAVSIAIFDLLPLGSAASVATGQALSPLPAVLFTGLLLPGRFSVLDAGVAVVVVGAVLVTLDGAFGDLARASTALVILLGASGAAMLTVLTALLARRGAGLVEIYVVRTAAAALLWLVLAPPRAIPPRALPMMSVRAGFLTLHFGLVIAAVQRGSPATVQTMVATTPLMLLLGSFVLHGERPPVRIALGACAAAAGVLVVLSLDPPLGVLAGGLP